MMWNGTFVTLRASFWVWVFLPSGDGPGGWRGAETWHFDLRDAGEGGEKRHGQRHIVIGRTSQVGISVLPKQQRRDIDYHVASFFFIYIFFIIIRYYIDLVANGPLISRMQLAVLREWGRWTTGRVMMSGGPSVGPYIYCTTHDSSGFGFHERVNDIIHCKWLDLMAERMSCGRLPWLLVWCFKPTHNAAYCQLHIVALPLSFASQPVTFSAL